jgi:SAM-dependent methyltransferase
LIDFIKKNRLIKNVYFLLRGTFDFFKFKPFLFVKQYIWYINKLNKLNAMKKNVNFQKVEYYPCLLDNVMFTPLDPTYFFQDSWAAKHIFSLAPDHLYDVGSSAKTIGILSQFTPITMVDIRPLTLTLPNLFFIEGSILELPFEDSSIGFLSSLCVIEHIGLGRYGDPIDPFGSEKAIAEIKRVLKIGGVFLFSVPVDSENKVYFNAHRAFTREYVLELFDDFQLLDEKYHYGQKMYDSYSKDNGFGTGMYMLKKGI